MCGELCIGGAESFPKSLSGIQRYYGWEFPGTPVVRISAFTAMDPASIPGQETKIPQAASLGQRKKQNYGLL